MPAKLRHRAVPWACVGSLATALAGSLLWPAPLAAGMLAIGLVSGAAIAWWLSGRSHAAIAREIRSQLEERGRAARYAEALARLASAASAREDPISILQLLVHEAAGAVGLTEAHVLIAPSALFPDGLSVNTLSSLSSPFDPDARDAPSRILAQILAGNDRESTCELGAEFERWIGFPISDLRKPVGILAVRTPHPPVPDAPPLPPEARELLARMAGQAGLVIENSALFGDVVRRAWEMAGIADLAGAIVTEADLPRLLDLAAHRAATITGAATGAILLADKRKHTWRVEVAHGVHQASLQGIQAEIDFGLPGRVIHDGRMRFADTPELLTGIAPDTPLEDAGAALFVPLSRRDSASTRGTLAGDSDTLALGCLVCLMPPGTSFFSGKDVRALTIIADQVAMAVENARLYQRAIQSEQLQHGVLRMVEELRRETTSDGVLAHGCRRATELLEMHAVVACQYPEGAVPPQPVQIHAPWKGAPATCSCRVGGEPSRRACLAAGALHNPGARPLRSPDDLRQCPLLRDLGAKSWAGVPLHVQGGPRTLVLFIDREDPDRFDDETLQRAELVCTYLGSALEMACVAEAQRQEVEVSNALLSIAHLIATERDANRILRTLNEVTLNCLSHSTAASFTWDGTGFAGVMDDGMPRPVSGASQLATTLRERKAPLLVENPRQSALIPQDLAEQMGDGPALVCPMLSHRGDLLGAMVLRPLHAMRQLPPRDIAVALGIARLGALAIDHAHLQEQVMHAERMKALGEMSAGVAHDLNNLLAAIMGNAQLALMNAKDTNTVSTAMETISRVCLEGAETIRRIHSITEEPHRAPAQLIDLAEVIRQAVQATRPHWDDRPQGQDVQVMLDLEAGLLVHGSAADLQEAIVHLITNAVDAMPEGGKLTLRCLSQHPWAILEVIDTGIGMEDAVRQRVFDPFFTTKAQRGHGLGLSMVYGIVHRHLGTIAVESAVGRGTTFTIGVPLATSTRTPSLSPAAPLPKLHVLVVDDESLIAETMAGLLRCLGHSVDTAPGGKEALEIWQAGTYDLVITDHGMRGMTGTELAQRLKEQAPHVPVLLITGWDIHQGVTENTRQVVDAVLQKPVSREELLRGMASALHAAAPRATQASGSRRVLVVDDHPAITRVIDEALSANGYTVECYADADAAIARLEKGLPDLVITDYRLEGASGVDLARMVKEKNRGIPVILITGWRPDEHDLNDIDLCLNKPFNVQELLDAAASLAQENPQAPR